MDKNEGVVKYFEQSTVAFLDGKWVNAEDANTSLYNQTMHYGHGVFDGIRSYKNAEGCNIFKGRDHFQRLIDSARQLNMHVTFDADALVHIAYQLLEKNNLHTAYIRPLVWLDPNMALTSKSNAHLFIAAWPWQNYLGHKPIDVMISKYRKPTSAYMPVNHKVVGHYTTAIQASNEARKLGYHEALLLDSYDHIAEGPAANIFFEKDGGLITPKKENLFAGITRSTIMALASEWGIEVVEKDITVEEAYRADHAFFCGTATEITPIRSINGEAMKTDWEDSHGYSLYMMYRQLVMSNEFQGLTIV